MEIAGSARLAGDVVPIERPGALPGAALDDIRHHVGQQVGDLRGQDLRCQILHGNHGLTIVISLIAGAAPGRPAPHAAGSGRIGGATALRAGDDGVGLLHYLAARIFDVIDIVRTDFEAAVGKGRVADGHLQRTEFGRAQRQGQIVRKLRFIKAEARHVVTGVLDADGPHQAYRNQIPRMHQRVAQSHRPVKLIGILVRAPGLFITLLIDDHRCVQHHAGRRESLVESRRINKGLESRAGLAPRLNHAVELALEEIEPADQ